ncbi:hypothetical protein O181_009056 [Austropuccinia psidii MF-1]|uniref:CCHC-type domain-containing protein n=1 Tax=Austropuccinia psidii MF-1 TaxID=1389203 RepID=A0A9Q3BR16_9BASI|nr:hypothetical protein [Austropuccinia psidii MF-1]
MKEIHGRTNWPWWKTQIKQKHSNVTWIWQNTMSFENYKYSVDKDPYEWCLRYSKRLEAIDPRMTSQMRNHKPLTQMAGELEHAVKCRCNHNCTLDEIENTLQDARKRTNIQKYTPYISSGFKEKQLFRVEFKDKAGERVAEVAKKKNPCCNCGSTDHYANNCPKAKKTVYSIEKIPEEESPTEDSDSGSMGDSIREQSDDDQDPRGNTTRNPGHTVKRGHATRHFQQKLVQKYTGCTKIPGHTKKRNGINKWNSHKNDLARNYLDNHLPNWENKLLPTEAKNFKSASGKITSIGTVIKEIIIPHKKGNIRLNPKPAFSIGEEPLGKIRGHDIELYLDVESLYPPMLRRAPYPVSLETRKEIEKKINELLDMNVIRKIGHNEIVEITTPVFITCQHGKFRLCGDFRALNNYTKADRYAIPGIPHALDKLAKA